MKDRPQGSVFGGYGFMHYAAPQNPQHPQRREADASATSIFNVAGVVQWLRARWSRR